MNKEAAETLAIRAIAHIAGDDELLQGLVAQTGMGLDDLRAGITLARLNSCYPTNRS